MKPRDETTKTNFSKSKRSILQAIIDDDIKNKVPLLTPQQRGNRFSEIREKYPQILKSDQAQYLELFKNHSVVKEHLEDYGLKTKKNLQLNKSNDMRSNITPQPSLEQPDNQIKSTDAVSEIKQDANTTMEKAKKEIKIHHTEKTVQATCKIFYASIKKLFNLNENLTEDELESLGDCWLPFFEEYLSSGNAKFIMPVLVTLGIISNKTRKKKDENEKKTEDTNTDNTQKSESTS